MMQKLSVIVPAYNEEGHIGTCIREAIRALNGLSYEIIVVDDGSTDNTYLEALSEAAGNGNVRVVTYGSNQGKGYALKHGFAHTTGDLVAFLDADLDIHPRQLLTLYDIMNRSGADIVIGCKRHMQSRLDYPLLRQLVSTGYLMLVHFLFDLRLKDTQTGIKLFRREVLQRVLPRIRVKRFAFDLGLLVGATRFNYCIVEAPVVITFQREKLGRIGLASIVGTWLDTLIIFYEASFWKWLSPGPAVKAWLFIFVFGLIAASFGIAHLLTFMYLPDFLLSIAYYLTLRFMDKQVRDWLLIGIGVILMAAAVTQLNKYILAAFARADSGDLASIIRATKAPQESSEVLPEPEDKK